MNTPPRGQPDKETQNLLARVEAAERRRQERLLLSTTLLPTTQSTGEQILPYLYAAMEACWIDAILIGLAGFALFGSREPLMPLWAPFVLLLGSLWLARFLELRDARNTPALDEFDQPGTTMPGTPLFVGLLAALLLLLIWVSIYASSIPLYNPAWLFAMLNDILLLKMHLYQILGILACSVYFAWRGIRLSRHVYEPGVVFSALRVGVIVLLVVIIVLTGQANAGAISHAEIVLFLLIPLFLFFALTAHALAQATFVRSSHPTGLEGSAASQERSIFMMIGMIGLLLLFIALSVGSFASPALLTDLHRALAPIGVAYGWLVDILAHIIVFLVTPIYWLLQALHFAPRLPQLSRPAPKRGGATHPAPLPDQAVMVASVLAVVVPVLFVVAMIMLIVWALRRRRVRLVTKRRDDEVHESLWSWSLFWMQIKALFLSLLERFFPRAAADAKRVAAEEIKSEPTARSVREVYRALLKFAGNRGYLRKRVETPNEFRQRLDEGVPLVEPQLGGITEAYSAVRYGGDVPDDAEAARVRGLWAELQRKWSGT